MLFNDVHWEPELQKPEKGTNLKYCQLHLHFFFTVSLRMIDGVTYYYRTLLFGKLSSDTYCPD